jgi:tRNA A37 threonylcarbamoyladenosine dehydratase
MITVKTSVYYDFEDLEINDIDRQIDAIKADLNELKIEIFGDLIVERNLMLERHEHCINSILELCKTGK